MKFFTGIVFFGKRCVHGLSRCKSCPIRSSTEIVGLWKWNNLYFSKNKSVYLISHYEEKFFLDISISENGQISGRGQVSDSKDVQQENNGSSVTTKFVFTIQGNNLLVKDEISGSEITIFNFSDET